MIRQKRPGTSTNGVHTVLNFGREQSLRSVGSISSCSTAAKLTADYPAGNKLIYSISEYNTTNGETTIQGE